MDSKALVAKWKEIGVPDELLPRNTRDVDWCVHVNVAIGVLLGVSLCECTVVRVVCVNPPD